MNKDRRRLLIAGGKYLAASTMVGKLGIMLAGCSDSSGKGFIPPPTNSPPSGTNTTTVAAAIDAQATNVVRKPTQDGMQIQSVSYGGATAQGVNTVYTVGNKRDDGTRPEDKQVQTGQVIDFWDTKNGSRVSIVVA